MSQLMTWYMAAALLGATLAATAVRWSSGRRARVTISALFLGLLALGLLGGLDLLGRPRPVGSAWIEQARAEEAMVLGTDIVEGKSISLMVKLSGDAEARLYALAWDRKMAEQIQGAQRDARDSGTAMVMRMPFERTWDKDEPRFYALPQPKLPEKDGDPDGPPQRAAEAKKKSYGI